MSGTETGVTADELAPTTAAERRLAGAWGGAVEVHLCAPPGQPCSEVDASGARDWSGDRAVRAGFLRGLFVSPARVLTVRLHGARIEGRLDLSSLVLDWPLALLDCSFDEPLRARSTTIAELDLSGSHLPGLDAPGLHARGKIALDRAVATGPVRLPECRCGGSLSAREARFATEEVTGDAAPVPALRLTLARIEGEVDLSRAACSGEARLHGATVGGQLICTGGTFTNLTGHALNAERAAITGSVLLREGFSATGQVRLLGVTIGGQLSCKGGTFTNHTGHALNAERAAITSSVFLRDGFSATGQVRFHGATIGGTVSCRSGRFENPSGTALAFRNATVMSTVTLGAGFEARGTVSLAGARLDRDMVATGSFEAGHGGDALDLQRAHVATSLTLDPEHCAGVVDLTDATVDTLRDRKERWPEKLRLEGFTYRHLEAGGGDAGDRLGWLDRNVDALGNPAFSLRTYEQLAAAYRAAGDARAVRKVGIAGQRAFRKRQLRQRRDLPQRAWSAFLDWTVAYGYRPGQALAWLAGLWVVSVGVVLAAERTGALRELAGEGDPTPDFEPVVYAADVLVPIVDLNQASYWQPAGGYALWYWVAIVSGWALATALAAGVTAALRRS